MVLACAVRHLETEGDLFLPTIVLRAVLPIRTGHKHQFVIVTGVEIAQIDLSREPADRVGQRGRDRFWVPRFVQVNGDVARMGAVNAVQDARAIVAIIQSMPCRVCPPWRRQSG